MLNGLIEKQEQPDIVNELILFLNEQGNISKEDALKILSNCDYLDGKSKIMLLKISDNETSKQINFEELEELSLAKDYDSIEKALFNDISQKMINSEEINIADINERIHRIHEIFLTNTLPFNFKLFEFFKHHQNYNSNNEKLYNYDIKKRDKTIAIDLFKILLESNNIGMRNFLEILQAGNSILNENESLNAITDKQKAILLNYRDVVYDLLLLIQGDSIEKTQNYIQDLRNIRETLNMDTQANIGNELLSRFFKDGDFEYTSIEDLLAYMQKKQSSINNQEEFNLEVGDLIKGTDIKYLDSVLTAGIRSKEFLFEGALISDATPLDTDFSEIDEVNLQEKTLPKIINSTYSRSSYGTTYYVIKKANYIGKGNSYANQENKTRFFRTGIGSTNINAIITNEWQDEQKYSIVKQGFYIPVINLIDGQVLFSKEEFNRLRDQMQGLSHYGMSNYAIDENAYIPFIIDNAKKLYETAEGKTPTEEKRKILIEFIRKNIGKKLTTEVMGDISNNSIELLDTGSTGRGTNIPGDGDFDLMLKCSSKEQQLEMIKKIKTFLHGTDKLGTNDLNIRYKNVTLDGLDEPIEVDITSEQKQLELDYSSDLCIRDRLETIRRLYGDEGVQTVVNNIIVAKQKLKETGCYKKSNSVGATEYGGFGGIGVENWILQNGGSFVKAMKTFLENSKEKNGEELDFEEFKKRYPIYDFGQNHRSLQKHNDHYIEGLTSDGYKELKTVFRDLLQSIELQKSQSDKSDSLGDSIVSYTNEKAKNYTLTDVSTIYSMIAKFNAHELELGIGEK